MARGASVPVSHPRRRGWYGIANAFIGLDNKPALYWARRSSHDSLLVLCHRPTRTSTVYAYVGLDMAWAPTHTVEALHICVASGRFVLVAVTVVVIYE
jgi:hypothetical protein